MVRNNKGVTLIEVLIASALLGLVLMLVSNFQLFGKSEYKIQSEKLQNQENISNTLKYLNREIRQADPQTVTVMNNQLNVNGAIYKLEDNTLKKGNEVVEENISAFTVEKIKGKTTSDKIKIELTSTGNRSVTLSSEIYFRE